MTDFLLANDDGIFAPGLKALREAMDGLGSSVVMAPDNNRSGSSNALTLNRPLLVKEIETDVYSVDGTPVDCVHLGLNGFLPQEPRCVVSGINCGANLGDDSLYSGTVAAALEGRFLGHVALAVSLASFQPNHWATAIELTRIIVSSLQELNLPPKSVLNVNIPDLPAKEIRGWKVTRLGHRNRALDVSTVTDPRGNKGYWIGVAGEPEDGGEGTDFHAVANGFVSVTPLHVDMTNHLVLADLENWTLDI